MDRIPVGIAALPVNEIFSTIQGEGSRVGMPSIFLRLQGCPIGCPWCDTKHTWDLDPAHSVAPAAIADKTRSAPTWAMMEVGQIIDEMTLKHTPRHVVITGGEPAQYDLLPLTAALVNSGFTAQIETSGTYPLRCSAETWVTVSPKIGMPGGYEVLQEALARADEIKMPVGKTDDMDKLVALLSHHWHRPGTPILLQPLSLSKKATDLCVAQAIANNWRVSLQVHAIAGWR